MNRPRKAHTRRSILRDLVGDALVWVGIVKPTLAQVDIEYRRLLQERARFRSAHSKGARKAQADLEARVLGHLQRGRAHV
jgi:hypothetical protein